MSEKLKLNSLKYAKGFTNIWLAAHFHSRSYSQILKVSSFTAMMTINFNNYEGPIFKFSTMDIMLWNI